MNMLQTLEDTVDFYSKNPRALEGSTCRYHMPDGRKCAVGRLILDPIDPSWDPQTADQLNPKLRMVDGTLLGDLDGNEIAFLEYLQSLHDGRHYWTDSGLTDSGIERVEKIKKMFKLGIKS